MSTATSYPAARLLLCSFGLVTLALACSSDPPKFGNGTAEPDSGGSQDGTETPNGTDDGARDSGSDQTAGGVANGGNGTDPGTDGTQLTGDDEGNLTTDMQATDEQATDPPTMAAQTPAEHATAEQATDVSETNMSETDVSETDVPGTDASETDASEADTPETDVSGTDPPEAEPSCTTAGTHLCGTECLSDSSPDSCGDSCTPCPAPTNGEATCDDGSCGTSCPDGTHLCGSECASDSSPDSCGASCTPCMAPTNGEATCNNGSCGTACPNGTHLCGSTCVDNTDPATCGGSCSPCASPTGGSAECNGTQCTPTCPNGMKLCEGACVSQSTFCEGEEKADGASCAQDFECLSLNCEDGVCCNTACDGQCEACNLSGSMGTCSPSTTARANAPCAGDGSSCSGVCDGSEANRDSCVYPASGTLCGESASCNVSTNQARTAETCNGNGSCNDATVTNCSPYDCQGDVCDTSCPSGEGVCDGSCVNTQTDPSHCGASCTTCGSSTPKCVGGSCRECTTFSDCTWNGAVCDSNNTCQCRQKSDTNLLLNPGFDSSSASWDTPPCADVVLATHDSMEDADLCPRSGAMELTYYGFCFGNLSQCANVDESVSYRYGFDYLLAASGAGQVRCAVEQFDGSNCSGTLTSSQDVENSGSTAGTWTHQTAMFLTSSDTESVRVYCQVNQLNAVWIDQIYLNPTTNNEYF